MAKLIDLTGKRYGMLTVITRSERTYHAPCGSSAPLWECICDCGNVVDILGKNIAAGKSTNCGCIREFNFHAAKRTHGDSRGTRLYRIFNNLKTRCTNPKATYFHRYGGRGISICQEWKDSYEDFRKWSMANGYADNLTIDRINNDGNYEPSNCQWITASENSKKQFADRRLVKEVS